MVRCSAVTALKSSVQMRLPASSGTGPWTPQLSCRQELSGLAPGWPEGSPPGSSGMQSCRYGRAARPRGNDEDFLSVQKVHKSQPEKTPILGTAGVAGAPRKAIEEPHQELRTPQTAEATV